MRRTAAWARWATRLASDAPKAQAHDDRLIVKQACNVAVAASYDQEVCPEP